MSGYIDMHCDTLMIAMRQHRPTATTLSNNMLDVDRLRRSDVGAQFFAMFLPQFDDRESFGLNEWPTLDELILKLKAVFDRTLAENKDYIRFAGNYNDLKKNEAEGLISAFLTMENGGSVEGKMEKLQYYYNLGVRLITLTWNDPNCFGQNHSSDRNLMNTGLTDFGKDAIRYMNDLGIIIDVSHLSDGGFYDVAKISQKPFVASHSDCRELCPATRNLTDDMIRTLADCGGVAGLNLEASFLNKDVTDPRSRAERIVDHAEHMIRVGGEECIGIGSDFDGIGHDLEIRDCTYMHLLFEAMDRRGFSSSLIDRIRFGNVQRVLKESL